MCMKDLIDRIDKETYGVSLNGERIKVMAYADDVVLVMANVEITKL